MSKMITGYMTIDNKFFESQDKADLHEKRLNFINNYKSKSKIGSMKNVRGIDLYQFVLIYPEMFEGILGYNKED